MPELPEVETVRRTLSELIVGKTIDYVSVHMPKMIKQPEDAKQFVFMLMGLTIESVERRGKFLLIGMGELVLVSHLRMEGRYGLFPRSEPVEKHTHVVFHFTDGTELRYKDTRQFGTMHLFNKSEVFSVAPLKKLGLEPLSPDFTLDAFKRKMKGRPTKIKPLLLNQECIVGLGNIYVDEALFASRIHPERPAETLKNPDLERLYEAIVTTLGNAVEAGGSSIKSYVNGQGEMGMFQFSHKVYGKKGEPCPTCNQLIERTVVGGRGTHFCPACQKEYKGKRKKNKG
jgi:formamidopyrimidine-DNA glycosylase